MNEFDLCTTTTTINWKMRRIFHRLTDEEKHVEKRDERRECLHGWIDWLAGEMWNEQ